MKEFRRPSGQGAGRGGFDKREQSSDFRAPRPSYGGSNSRPGFGSHKGDHNAGERREVKHQAVCSECNKTCEVPFRPNGSKPVYCKDCFGAKKGVPSQPTERREERAAAPARDSRIDELKSQVDSMQSKLDRILRALEGGKTVSEQLTEMPKPAAQAPLKKVAAKPVAKLAVVKKPMKKAAPAKAPAKAKPVAKKKK